MGIEIVGKSFNEFSESVRDTTVQLSKLKDALHSTVNILGAEWKIEYKTETEDSMFENANGYCDYTGRRIVVLSESRKNDSMDDFKVEQQRIIRHEILHAFLCESGLIGNTYSVENGWAKNEEMVDWFAIQSPKIYKVYIELGLI